jgi:glycosyltransferase involved in cell wall biosynthesis
MRIAQIVASLESRHGGPSRSVLGLARGLAGQSHSVELLGTAPDITPRSESGGNLTTRLFPREFPRAFSASALLRAHLDTARCDIVHHHGLWLRPLHYAHRAARRQGCAFVISPRGMMSPWAWNHHRRRKVFAARFIHPGALAAATGWHATSEAEAADIRALGFNQPVCVAPNGVLPPVPADEAVAAARWRELLPSIDGRRVALFYSRLHAKKRVLELIDLWLSRPRGDWVLLIVGIPEQYTVNQLDAYIVRNGGQGRVHVQDGTHEPPPYAVASLFLLPSHSENFGLVVAEALVRGVPVLTTDGTPWQALETNQAGRCVSWENYGPALDAFLGATESALRLMGEHARHWATSAFSWSASARVMSAFYEQLRSTR